MKQQHHHQFCANLHLLDGGRGQELPGNSLSPISYILLCSLLMKMKAI